GDLLGLAFNLDEDEIGCIILGDASSIEEGDPVKQTGKILSIPVGDGFLGRVVDALGRPLDDKGPIPSDRTRVLELQAPNVVSRQPVKEPLYTGIAAIDAMTAIGRGQRELIIGDRQTGKTAIALDAIIAQKPFWGTDRAVKCIYVAVGQKASTVAEVVETLREQGALEYTVVVNAAASDPAPFQYVAPYGGAAIGANWMYEGKHVLIAYDDLSKQAVAYREISLLLRRPPGACALSSPSTVPSRRSRSSAPSWTRRPSNSWRAAPGWSRCSSSLSTIRSPSKGRLWPSPR